MMNNTSQPKWDFMSVSGAYEKKGLNDSGVETFKDDSFKSLAREICQNSLDAKPIVSDGDSLPIIVEFHRYSNSSDEFPDKETMLDAFKRAQFFWQGEGVDETVQFFKEAEETLKADSIEWMRISDFNTSGLIGVENPANASGTTPWSSLVMSSGVSNKPGEAGGSFGIGKFATFSCSAIRTCFYSTITDSNQLGSQGVSRLVTFSNDNNTRTLGIGYFRKDDGEALDDIIPLDPSFKREMAGTDIFVPGFLPDKSWIEDVQKAVLEGFLFAIFNKKLVVRLIDGNSVPVTIDRKWLDDRFSSRTLPDETILQNYKALILGGTENIFHKKIGEDGSIELRLLIEPNLNHRIAMIRGTGMKIFDKGNFPSSISFSGVLIVHGVTLNKRIKTFENPQHTKWEPKRNKRDKKLYDEIIQFCRESLKSLVEDNNPEETGANLGDVLPATGDAENREVQETLTPKITMLRETKRIKKRPTVQQETSLEGETLSGTDENGTDSGSGGGIGTIKNDSDSGRDHGGTEQGDGNGPSDEGDQNKLQFKSIEAGSARFICADERSAIYRLILVPTKKEEKAAIAINAVAELSTYPADIISAELSDGTPLTVDVNRILGLHFQKDSPIKINLKMNYTEYVSLEVEWYGIV